METMFERARDVGRLVAQTDEYAALKRANARVADDRELVELLNGLEDLQEKMTRALSAGREPEEEDRTAYEGALERLQGSTVYQGIVAAQANFDRLMMRINEEIARGLEAGEQSRIILPS